MTSLVEAVRTANHRTVSAYLFGVVLGIYLASATYSGPMSADVYSAATPAWQLVTQGTLDLTGYPDGLLDGFRRLNQVVEVDGALYSNRNPGIIAFGLPFYGIAAIVTPTASLPMWPQAIAGALAAAGTVLVVFLLMARLTDRIPAIIGALTFAFATGTWSVSADGLWGHGPAQLFLSLAVLAMATQRNPAAGLGFGAALTIRPYSGFAAAACGLHQSWTQRSMRPALGVALTTAVGLGAFLLYTRTVFGAWSVYGGYTGRDYLQSNVGGSQGLFNFPLDLFWSLVHPAQGLLVYSPFVILLLFGLPAAWRHAPPWVRSAFLGGVAFFVAQLYANTWNAGDTFFGYRYPLEFLAMGAPMGLLAYVHGIHPRRLLRRVFPYTVAAALALHFLGAVVAF